MSDQNISIRVIKTIIVLREEIYKTLKYDEGSFKILSKIIRTSKNNEIQVCKKSVKPFGLKF